jgi:hypothetical protein
MTRHFIQVGRKKLIPAISGAIKLLRMTTECAQTWREVHAAGRFRRKIASQITQLLTIAARSSPALSRRNRLSP